MFKVLEEVATGWGRAEILFERLLWADPWPVDSEGWSGSWVERAVGEEALSSVMVGWRGSGQHGETRSSNQLIWCYKRQASVRVCWLGRPQLSWLGLVYRVEHGCEW